ncbi:MAG: B12-binding domain-containing radical SAM protein [Candidatus Omnitrophica bacterium]|nr:B12-binding domain-containing radical SAM protein [Candidatus Omnitrophota bacterium]
MRSKSSLLRKSFETLNSLPWIIFIAYILNEALQGRLDPFLIVFLAIIKIYLYSGIFGALVEIASGEDLFTGPKRIVHNSNRSWAVYFLLITLPFLIRLALTNIFPFFSVVAPDIFVAHADLFVFYLLAQYFINKKYKGSVQPARQDICINFKELCTLVLLHLIQMAMFYIPRFMPAGESIASIARFLSIYLHLLIFLYVTNSLLRKHPEIEKAFTHPKELYLISTAAGKVLNSLIHSLMSRQRPAAFFVLRALTPKTYSIKEFSQLMWHNRYYKENVLVAITCCTANSPESYKIAKEFKERGSTVIMGGPHVSFMPEEALEYCDSVVVGECEGIWSKVLEDYENSCLRKTYLGKPVEDYFSVVHNELLHSPSSAVLGLIETSRGCKFHCHFCSVPVLNPGKVRKAPVDKVVSLIKNMVPRQKGISFNDNNIYNDPAHAKDLFAALKPLKIKWTSFCTLDIAKNDKTLRLAKESGCSFLYLGLETFSSAVGKDWRGKFAMADHYVQYSKKIKRSGIKIGTNFIFGFDTDSFKSFLSLWKLAFRITPELIGFSLLTPMPGTKLYDDMLSQNRLTNLNWDKYLGSNLVFRHPHLNDFFLSKIYFPFVPLFFFFTASKVGIIIFLFLCVFLPTFFI